MIIEKAARMILTMFAALIIMSLFGCASSKKYDLYLDPGIESEKTKYREGELVSVQVHNVMDEITTILVDGVAIPASSESTDDYTVVSFIMPSHDVYVTAGTRNISVNDSDDRYLPENYTLLLSYYDRVTGTEMYQDYSEYCLYASDKEDYVLVVVDHQEYENGITVYSVSQQSANDVLHIIEENEMEKWPSMDDCYPLVGAFYSCSFITENGRVSITSDDPMPENGYQILGTLSNAIKQLPDEDKIININ